MPNSPNPQLQTTVPQMLRFTWSAGPAMPQGLQDNSIQVMDNWLISVGGFCGGRDEDFKPGVYPRGFLNKVWGLNLADEAAGWVSLPPFPAEGRQAMQGTVADDCFCVWGGFNYTAPYTYKDGYRLFRRGGSWDWEELPPLPCPSVWAGACALGSRIYLLGGADYDRKRFYTHTDRTGTATRLGARLIMLDMDDLGSGWQELTPCPGTPRCIPASAVVDDKLYAIGGVAVSDSGAYLNVVDSWCYNPFSDSWERLRDFPMSGSGSHSGMRVYRNRYVLIPAGYQYEKTIKPDGSICSKYGQPSRVARTWENHPSLKDGQYYNHFYVYDVSTDLYGSANPLPCDAVHPPTVVYGDSVYLFPSETAGFVWEGEYFGHHPEFVLKGAIKVLDWE